MAIPIRVERIPTESKSVVQKPLHHGIKKWFWPRWESNPQISVLNADAYAKFGYWAIKGYW